MASAASMLEHERNEALGPPHIFEIGLADYLAKRLLLNLDPVQVAQQHTDEQSSQAGPISHCQSHPQHRQEGSTVGRMANSAVWSSSYHRLIRRHSHVAGKIASQRPDGVPTQGNTQQDAHYPKKKERVSLPEYCCCWK